MIPALATLTSDIEIRQETIALLDERDSLKADMRRLRTEEARIIRITAEIKRKSRIELERLVEIANGLTEKLAPLTNRRIGLTVGEDAKYVTKVAHNRSQRMRG